MFSSISYTFKTVNIENTSIQHNQFTNAWNIIGTYAFKKAIQQLLYYGDELATAFKPIFFILSISISFSLIS